MCLWANIVHFQLTACFFLSFLSGFLTFLILSYLLHSFLDRTFGLSLKINVSLADKLDELNMKKIVIAVDGFPLAEKAPWPRILPVK